MFKRILVAALLFSTSVWAQNVYPPVIPQNSTNLLPLNNTWTGLNTFSKSLAINGGDLNVPALNVIIPSRSTYNIPATQISANEDYGSFGDTNTHFIFAAQGGKNVDNSATTGSWQLGSFRYIGYGGADSSAFFSAGQELMAPIAGINNNYGRFFGNNPECFIPTGMTPAECTGEEIDQQTLSNVSGDRHGLRVVDIGSTGSHAIDDSGISVLSSGGIGWTYGLEFGAQSGFFPVPAGGTLITTAPSSLALNSAIYFQNLTGTPTYAWVMLPANAKGVCFGVGNCAAGYIGSVTSSNGGGLVFDNNKISFNFASAEATITSGGSLQLLGGIYAPNAAGGTPTKTICSDASGNWWAQNSCNMAAVSCSGTPTSSFASVNGIVTHC